MSIEGISTLISGVGFPIVCCVILWRYISTTQKGFIKTISENTKVLTENTKVLSKLCDKLERWKHE